MLDVPTLLAGFAVSTVGFSVFLYGKKQARLPQLVAGLVMMIVPFVLPGAGWIAIGGALVAGATWFAVRAGY